VPPVPSSLFLGGEGGLPTAFVPMPAHLEVWYLEPLEARYHNFLETFKDSPWPWAQLS